MNPRLNAEMVEVIKGMTQFLDEKSYRPGLEPYDRRK